MRLAILLNAISSFANRFEHFITIHGVCDNLNLNVVDQVVDDFTEMVDLGDLLHMADLYLTDDVDCV